MRLYGKSCKWHCNLFRAVTLVARHEGGEYGTGENRVGILNGLKNRKRFLGLLLRPGFADPGNERCRQPGMAFVESTFGRVFILGTREEIALTILAAEILQQRKLGFCLDAFGNYLFLKVLGERDYRL